MNTNMIDLLPFTGIVIITLGLAFKINTLLVILTAGLVTGFIADMDFMQILSILGRSFTENRYMSLFILVLPMIGILERFGLRERAEQIISSIKSASASKVLMSYLSLRKLTNALGLSLGGHPSMVRPLIAPMTEAAAEKGRDKLSKEESQQIKAMSAASENFANFFSQLIFIGSGGLLLIKAVLEDNGYSVELSQMSIWAIPTALFSCLVFGIYSWLLDRKLAQKNKTTHNATVEHN